MSCSDAGNSDVIAAASVISAAQGRTAGTPSLGYDDLREDFHRLKAEYQRSVGKGPADPARVRAVLDQVAAGVESDERISMDERVRVVDRIRHAAEHAGTSELVVDEGTVEAWRRFGTHEHLDMLRERQAARAQAQYGAASRIPRDFGVHSPEDAAARWATATEEQRRVWMRQAYASLGRADGLPAAVRDQANRRALAEDLEAANAQLAALEQGRTLLGSPIPDDKVHAYRQEWQKKAEVLRTIDRELDLAAANGVQTQLLRYSANDTGRAVVALGDLDKAQHVAVLVPGMSTTVPRSLASHMTNAQAVKDEATVLARIGSSSPEPVATVAWIGYHAPKTVPGAAVPWRANKGAQELRKSLRGIRAASDAAGGHQHITVLGHSYGSLTTGKALREHTGVDDVAFFGSPGVGAHSSSELKVDPDHVYVAQARRDVVAILGRYGDPMREEFGAQVLSTKGGRTDPLGNGPERNSGHSGYYRRGTESLSNLAAIVAGRPQLARTQEHRTFAQWAGSRVDSLAHAILGRIS